MNLENELRSWDDFNFPTEPQTTTVCCGRCQKTWQTIPGDGHWNFCPHCGNVHSALFLLWMKPEALAAYRQRLKSNRRVTK